MLLASSFFIQQSLVEYDFSALGEKYEAKFPLGNNNGKKYFSREGDLNEFIKAMYKEAGEFERCRHGKNVNSLELYVHMKESLEKVEFDENVVFFIPYPIVLDAENNPLVGAKDLLSKIYDGFMTEGILKNRRMIVVYASHDEKYVLREMGTKRREYLVSEMMKKYIRYKIQYLNDRE